jgi:hypothetical protein
MCTAASITRAAPAHPIAAVLDMLASGKAGHWGMHWDPCRAAFDRYYPGDTLRCACSFLQLRGWCSRPPCAASAG